jgi:hypothetical protein
MGENHNRYIYFKIFIRCQIIYLIERTGFFKISNLVFGAKEIATSLYSSLEGQRQSEEPVGREQGFIRVTTRETALLK